MMSQTALERSFVTLMRIRLSAELYAAMTAEYRFHPKRRWRFDFAWPDSRLAVEVQGGTFSRRRSGHSSGMGLQNDYDKLNAAAVLGWRVLQFSAKHLQETPVQVADVVREILEAS